MTCAFYYNVYKIYNSLPNEIIIIIIKSQPNQTKPDEPNKKSMINI